MPSAFSRMVSARFKSGSASAKRPLDRRPSCVEPPPAQSLWYLHLQSTIWLP